MNMNVAMTTVDDPRNNPRQPYLETAPPESDKYNEHLAIEAPASSDESPIPKYHTPSIDVQVCQVGGVFLKADADSQGSNANPSDMHPQDSSVQNDGISACYTDSHKETIHKETNQEAQSSDHSQPTQNSLDFSKFSSNQLIEIAAFLRLGIANSMVS